MHSPFYNPIKLYRHYFLPQAHTLPNILIKFDFLVEFVDIPVTVLPRNSVEQFSLISELKQAKRIHHKLKFNFLGFIEFGGFKFSSMGALAM